MERRDGNGRGDDGEGDEAGPMAAKGVKDMDRRTETRTFEGFVGSSPPMRRLYRTLARVGPSTASVLLVGESGTGKELAARTLHRLSERRARPFIALNCAAIPETLLESELFGHEKGAFTGATSMRQGCFELANEGTLFLDELGAMPLASQAKLLRALEERTFRRLRGAQELSVDVRVIAALSERPEVAVAEGRLREDLLYRINVFTIPLPPLRERPSDVLALGEHFIEQFARENGKEPPRIDDEAGRVLARHAWPGNVRELRNAMERAVILASGPVLEVRHLPRAVRSPEGAPSAEVRSGESEADPKDCRVRVGMTLEEAARALTLRTLEAEGFNKTRTARVLGVSPRTVYNKLKAWSAAGHPEAVDAERRAGNGRSERPRAPEKGRLVSLGAVRARRAAG